MTGYTKLFGTILDSTVWRGSKELKVLWVTMMAMAGKEGIVESSIPGLADRAKLTLEETETALQELLSPDKYSRTKEHEGRRIKAIDGGWVLLNYGKYREKMDQEEQRQRKRAWENAHRSQRPNSRYRNRKQTLPPTLPPPTPAQPPLPPTQAEADTDAYTKAGTPKVNRGIYHLHSRTALYWLREKTGRSFREVDSNLGLISARLSEPGVDIEGVKLMIERQVKRWKGTQQEEYLRPETLFGKEKFDGYYAARNMPINENNGQAGAKSFDRNKGTFNEGKADLYVPKPFNPNAV